jgi:hypothetical protein
MKDEAVSPVVAFMLLLMVVVSFISLLNAYYIPSLKQQAEIDHLHQVHQSFLSISSDVDKLLSFGNEGMVKERIQLGGGDVLFSPLRSSGTVQVSDEGRIASLIVNNSSGIPFFFNCSLISLSYHPVSNFWINQGYQWKSGIVTITKGKRTTWIDYTHDAEALSARNSFISLLSTPTSEESRSMTYPGSLSDTSINFRSMGLGPGQSFTSSNGFAGVDLHLTIAPVTIDNASSIHFDINTSSPFYENIKNSYNRWVNQHYNYSNCIRYTDPSTGVITVTFITTPVSVVVYTHTLAACLT